MDHSDAEALRALRLAKGLPVEEVAEALGIAPPTLLALEGEELRGYPTFHQEWARIVDAMPARARSLKIHAASAALALAAVASIGLLTLFVALF